MPKLYKFTVAIIIQIAIIVSIIILKLMIISNGTDILLQIEPVDPRDPLRGDYADISYSVSRVNKYLITDSTLRRGDNIYVTLQKDGKFWEVERASKNKPVDENKIYLKGIVDNEIQEVSPSRLGGSEEDIFREYRIKYPNLEQFFIAEGSGSNFILKSGDEAYAWLTVDENGNGVLRQVYLNGKPWP